MAGRAVNYFHNAPASDSDIIIWKLHGSCNFLPHGGVTATRGVSFSPGVTFGTGIRPVNPNEVAAYCTGNTALYPVMAVYARAKPVQIAPADHSANTGGLDHCDKIRVYRGHYRCTSPSSRQAYLGATVGNRS